MFFDKDEGKLLFDSRLGTFKCAIITDPKPCLINDLYGYNSTSRILFLLNAIVGNVLCESLDVSPCPGKCFAHANIPHSVAL